MEMKLTWFDVVQYASEGGDFVQTFGDPYVGSGRGVERYSRAQLKKALQYLKPSNFKDTKLPVGGIVAYWRHGIPTKVMLFDSAIDACVAFERVKARVKGR